LIRARRLGVAPPFRAPGVKWTLLELIREPFDGAAIASM
jgi:hypothetical protein